MFEMTAGWAEQIEVVIHLAIAGLLGALIGIERAMADRPAGVRTLTLAAAAACLLLSLGEILIREYERIVPEGTMIADPVRIMQAIIIGISFLGAGTIITDRGRDVVKGLTTAATVLFVCAIGMAVALKLYVLAVGGTALALLVLIGLRIIETKLGFKEEREAA